jgi:hypothetical protein
VHEDSDLTKSTAECENWAHVQSHMHTHGLWRDFVTWDNRRGKEKKSMSFIGHQLDIMSWKLTSI